MFATYATAIRALYLSAIVTAPVTVAWYLLQLVLDGEYNPTGLAVFAAFAGILLVPTVRAWRRLARHHELVPGERLRTRAWVAVPVAVLCLIGLLALLFFFFAWYFANNGMERERGFFVLGLLAPGVLAYAIALPAGEALLVGRYGGRVH